LRIYLFVSVLIISLLMVTSSFSLPAHATPEKWATQLISNNVIGPSYIALDSNNYPHIAYTEWEPPVNSDYVSRNGRDDVIYASWNGAKWINQTVASDAAVYDLALDSLGNAHILYKTLDGTEDLMYAYWTGHNWSTQTVDHQASSGGSLAIDSSGNPHIAYFTTGNATSPFFLK
jgi:hypothetical protein